MDILDKLSLLLRSALDEPSDSTPHGGATHPGASHGGADPDWREAWNELDEYMRRATAAGGTSAAGEASADRGPGASGADPSAMRAGLRRDFENLELAPGTPLDEVRRQFRRELARYHPDRFADDPEKFATATAVTRELIQSYRRIRDYYGASRA